MHQSERLSAILTELSEDGSVEVADLAWVAPADLASWDILPADRPLVERLATQGLPTDRLPTF